MENPELLFGIPFLILGLLGLLVAASLFAVPADESNALATAVGAGPRGAHPQPSEYVVIGLILGMITAVEVMLYYIDLDEGVLVVSLILLSASKFLFVVLWFMHLRFDSPLLTRLFFTGLFGAIALFTVVMATLGAGLV